MRNDFAYLVLPTLVLGITLNCAQSHLGGGDGESHFLTSCEACCEGDLQCICGICTRVCDATDDCKGLPGDAVCVSPDQLDDARHCRSNDRINESVCDVRCETDGDCAALGEGFTCQSGFCRDDGYSDAGHTPEEDAGGEAGAGTGGGTSEFIATRKYPGPCIEEFDGFFPEIGWLASRVIYMRWPPSFGPKRGEVKVEPASCWE